MDLMINMTITVTVTALAILFLKTIFKNKMSPRLHLYIWIILVIRILIPVFPKSPISVFNFLPSVVDVREEVRQQESTETGNTIGNAVAEQEYITGDIVFRNFSRPFSIKKNVEKSVTIIWMAGAVILFSYFLAVYILFSQRLRSMEVYRDEGILEFLDSWREKMNIKRNVSIRLYDGVPMLKGFFKPVIVLPKGYNAQEIKQMIIHELCHLKHNDILLNVLSTIFLCLNWYNPVMWICYSVFKGDIEVLCDQKVMEITGNKKDYAKLLIKISAERSSLLPMTTCMNNGKNQIKRRIYFMVNFKETSSIWKLVIALSVVLLCVGCLSRGVSPEDNEAFSFKSLNSLLGKEKEEVFQALKIDPEADADVKTVGEKEETFTIKEPIKIEGKDCRISISFYNGIFMAFNYAFDDIDSGYSYAKQIREQAEDIYGEPATYPTLENRLDNLKSVEDIDPSDAGVNFYEEWTVEASQELLERLLEGRKSDRFTLMVRLMCLPNDTSIVTVRYGVYPAR